MIYVMSDIHGEYEKYLSILNQIRFSEEDSLFVLGDAIDRGPDPIRVLTDMASRDNVYLIKGNHEALASCVLRRLNVEITRDNAETQLDAAFMLTMLEWQRDGGETTLRAFRGLAREERLDLLDYLDDAPLYDVVDVGERTFVLVHSGLGNFEEKKKLCEYTFEELACMRHDFERQYYADRSIYIVCGHTPTLSVTGRAEIYQSRHNILIDCGATFGGKLACLCLDTMRAYYA